MKNYSSFILILVTLCLSCGNRKANDSNLATTDSTISFVEMEKQNRESIQYVYFNDSFCQELSIKNLGGKFSSNLPNQLEFSLVFFDRTGRFSEVRLSGLAKLSSQNESFSDNSNSEEGDYIAADYDFDTKDYKIKIRLDVGNYEACVVSITADQLEKVLNNYTQYFKNYPNYDIMKMGKCL